MSPDVITAIIGVVGVVMGSIITGLYARRKNKSDAAGAITDAAVKLVDPLRERIDVLEKKDSEQDQTIDRLNRQLDKYAKRVIYLMGGIETLIRQIKESGCSPAWIPDPWEPGD